MDMGDLEEIKQGQGKADIVFVQTTQNVTIEKNMVAVRHV